MWYYVANRMTSVTRTLRSNDLLKKNIALGTIGLFIASSTVLPTFAALNVGESPYGVDDWVEPDTDYIESIIAEGNSGFNMDDGVLTNPLVSTTEDTLTQVTPIEEHTITDGETIQSIANDFGISPDTILVNNGLEDDVKLKVGGTLVLTNVDGFVYEIKNDTDIASIAKEYNVSLDDLASLNDLTTKAKLKKGEHIVIPGAEVVESEKKKMQEEKARLIAQQEAAKKALEAKKMQDAAAQKRNPTTSKSTSTSTPFKSPATTTSAGGIYQGRVILWPTVGTKQLSQGYKGAIHPGIDIVKTGATRTTAIVAAHEGTVVAAKGGWNGGYGNMIIVDNGKGMQTLYAHLRDIYVTTGQKVSAGEKIGWMGNTGHVYGPTGLHLHFEVRINHVRVNPLNYL